MIERLRAHWPEYLIEAFALGTFMVSASAFTVLLELPSSPVRQAIADPFVRRALIGVAMGLTAIALIYSPWGKRSGAHMNPAVTLAFWSLGKINPADALWYVAFQAAGGLAGMLLATLLLRGALATHPVDFVATRPGPWGPSAAFLAEIVISFVLMLTILTASNAARLARYTGIFAGALVALYITLEAPVSGMSMNPARSLASAVASSQWNGFWVYVTAPPIAMLAAAWVYTALRGIARVRCAKLQHDSVSRCIFRCGYAGELRTRS